jgi:hypothetical protein
MNNDDINITAIKQGKHMFVAIYKDAQTPEAMRTMGRWASDADNPMTWMSAARMCNEMRRATEPECTGKR